MLNVAEYREKLYEDIDKYIQKDEDSEEGTIGY